MKVGFLIRTLEQTGGAEQQLVYLAQGLRARGIDAQVFCFYGIGELRSSLESHGIAVHDAGKSGRWDLRFLRRLRGKIRQFAPGVLHSYLETANIATAVVTPFRSRPSVVWGIRSSDMDVSRYDWTRRAVGIAETAFSHFVPRLIVTNSHAGAVVAISRGMPRHKVVTVHNGIDTDKFRPSRGLGERYRRVWGAGERTLVVGRIGRFDPMKDYDLFLSSARELSLMFSDILFVCVGDYTSDEGKRTVALANRLGLQDKMRWVLPTQDIASVLNAMDLLVSSSAFGEGFPNVVGEAMSCAVPVVATDVGDSAIVVSDRTRVVPRRNRDAMVAAVAQVLSQGIQERKKIGDLGRSAIVQNFSLAGMIDRTIDHYREVSKPASSGPRM